MVDFVSSGVALVEVGFLHQRDAEGLNDIVWHQAALKSPNQPYSTWLLKPPMGLEGPYRIYLRLTDGLGNQRIQGNIWQGELDTKPPQINYTCNEVVTITAAGVETYFEVMCRAEDYNLSQDNFSCPNNAEPTLIYNTEEWLVDILSLVGLQKLEAMETPLVIMDHDPGGLVICDIFENCGVAGNYIYLPMILTSIGN